MFRGVWHVSASAQEILRGHPVVWMEWHVSRRTCHAMSGYRVDIHSYIYGWMKFGNCGRFVATIVSDNTAIPINIGLSLTICDLHIVVDMKHIGIKCGWF